MKIAVVNSYNKKQLILQKEQRIRPRSGMEFDSSKNSNQYVSFCGDSVLEPAVRTIKNRIFSVQANKILETSNDFGMKEYLTLDRSQKTTLSRVLPCSKSDIQEILRLYETMKTNLNTRYPDGCTLVSIGRSPAVFAKLRQCEGESSILCPMSEIGIPINTKDYYKTANIYKSSIKKYFERLGLTSNLMNQSEKPILFTGVTDNSDKPLMGFKKLLTIVFEGAEEQLAKNVKFLGLNIDLLERELDCQAIQEVRALIRNWLKNSKLEDQYSPIPKATLTNVIQNPDNILNWQMPNNSKLLQFHLIDELQRQK